MQAASLFVYPSLYEGFGLPVAEAMACGVPVVASNTPALAEVVGEAGRLVPSGDAAALAGALAQVAADPALAAELGRRGRERARRFSWDAAAARLAAVFHEALL
jgi:glycosyltransferase involved in cell wall biosynthesis